MKAWIKKASNDFGVPCWMIAQILQCESSMGTDLKKHPEWGIGQIQDAAATELKDTLHHVNPDGSAWKLSDRGDEEKSVYAVAHWLLRCSDKINVNSTNDQYYSWVLRAYRFGYPITNQYGADNNWTLPGTVSTHGYQGKTDDKQPDYSHYWSPIATQKAEERWSGVGQ
jgi:hypothetical protein